MATKIFSNINNALSALQSGETLVAQGDNSSLRSATLLERASIAFNRKVLHREPQWLQQNNAAVGKALSKLLTESKKPLSPEEASRLTRTLRFAGLEQVAQVISDSQVKRPAPADFREAFERQNDVWSALLDPTEDRPEDTGEIKERLTAYVKKNKLGDAPLVSVFTKLNAAEAASDELARAQITTQALEDFHRRALGYSTDLVIDLASANVVKGSYIGEGAFGTVTHANLGGKEKVIKEFLNGKTFPITLDTTNPNHPNDPKLLRSPEVAAAFLNQSESDAVVVPTHFIVREKDGTKTRELLVPLRDKEFRAWAKKQLTDHAGDWNYSLEITGELQDVAPGEEVRNLVNSGGATAANVKKIAAGYLDALAALGKRGFVHGDIKPQNAFFDQATGKLKLIDTGSLTKVSKKVEDRPNTAFSVLRGATPDFTLPDGINAPLGFAHDLYSTGISIIQVAVGAEFDNTKSGRLDKFLNQVQDIRQDMWTSRITPEEGKQRVRDLIQQSLPLSGNPAEQVGVRALEVALTKGGQWDDLRGREQYGQIIAELKAAL
jgi:hypothetical protein